MSRKTIKEEAGIRGSRQTISLIPAFTDHCITNVIQEAVRNIMRISISMATTLSLTKLKSSMIVVTQAVALNVLLFKYQ